MYGEDFFASKKQLSYETKEHIEGYLFSIGVEEYTCPVSFEIYAAIRGQMIEPELTFQQFIYKKCKTVEYCQGSFAENVWYYVLH